MRTSMFSVAALGLAAAVVVSGCSSSKSSSGASGSSSGASGAAQVGVILPDTTTSTRYTLFDQPLLTKSFQAAGVKADIQNAQGSTTKFAQIADGMIQEGVKVLMVDALDATSGAKVEQKAKTAGIKVIDYDRLNLGGSADYYVSFDNVQVGKLQGTGLVNCLTAKGVKNAQVIELDGAPTDNNATLFKQGYNSVLDPLYSAGTLKKISETAVKDWDNTVAGTDFSQALTANGGKVDGVLAANDGLANSVITVLKSKNLQVPVTGQDATIQGLQHVLQGDQCMTVFKDVSKEADAAAKLAISLAKGDTSGASTQASGTLHDPTGNRDVPSVLLTPESITKANVKDVVTAGALTAAQICQGIESVCSSAGVS